MLQRLSHRHALITSVLVLLAGLVLLVAGASVLVKGSASLALRHGVAPLVVGLTIVAFGTSAPELVVSAGAALRGAGGIAIGNVIGSNIANIGLILGIAALVRPVAVERNLLRVDTPLMILGTAVAAAMLWDGRVGRLEGGLLAAGLFVYVGWTLHQARKQPNEGSTEVIPTPTSATWMDPLFIIGGLGVLVLGANLMVTNAVDIASTLGVSNAIIGLTIVGVGTSLPEMATSIVATLRGESSIAAGNVVGSNLFNALGILGVSAVVSPLHAPGITQFDVALLLASALVLFPIMWTGRSVSRAEGAALLAGYVAYVGYLVTTA